MSQLNAFIRLRKFLVFEEKKVVGCFLKANKMSFFMISVKISLAFMSLEIWHTNQKGSGFQIRVPFTIWQHVSFWKILHHIKYKWAFQSVSQFVYLIFRYFLIYLLKFWINIYEKQFLNFIDQFLSKKLIIQKMRWSFVVGRLLIKTK